MPVYEVKTSKPVSFLNADGVSFEKTRIEGEVELHFNGDTYILLPLNIDSTVAGRFEITARLDAILGINQFFFDDFNSNNFRIFHNGANNQWRSRIFPSASLTDRVDLQDTVERTHVFSWDANGLNPEWSIDGATVPTATVTSQLTMTGGLVIGNNNGFATGIIGAAKDVRFYDAKTGGTLLNHWPINEGVGVDIVDIVGGANGTLTIGSGTWISGATQDEIATNVAFTAQAISPSNRLPFSMDWINPEIAGDVTEFRYDKLLGNLLDPNSLDEFDQPIPLESQTIVLKNCLDPTEGVSNFTATVINSSTIDLAWIEPDKTSLLSPYKLYRDNVYLQDIAIGQTTFTDTGLTMDTTYTYKIETYWGFNIISSSTVSEKTILAHLFVPLDHPSLITSDGHTFYTEV